MVNLTQIKALDPWFYQVRIGDIVVKPGVYPDGYSDRKSASLVVRQQYRKKLLVDEVVKRFDFRGAKILDVACNCGYWSSIYLSEYGAESMIGIEGREQFTKQAVILYTELGIGDKAIFVEGNVMDVNYPALGRFDFVLCAGILYHLPQPDLLLRRIAEVNTHTLVIDTRVGDGRPLAEPRNRCFNAIDETAHKIVPRYEAIVECLRELGYYIEQLEPPPGEPDDIGAVDSYVKGNRVCLVCKR